MFNSLQDRLSGIFSVLKGKGRLSESDIKKATREIRMALLEADVNFKVVKEFSNNIKEKCLTSEVMESLTPAQNVIKIVLDELTRLLGSEDAKLELGSKTPHVIMLVGLQGSGKTTACAKLAYLLKKQGHTPQLVACDIHRPAAADQLETLAKEADVAIYRDTTSKEGSFEKSAQDIAKKGVECAIENLCDVVIIDTAGRLHIDEEMMNEASAIKDATNPDSILMVVDAMTGQDVVNVADAFAKKLDFDGVIMSKMDGDSRGGGALSIKQVTGKPILYISSGEKMDSLEEFHPDRMAKRILGMGDMVSLIESAITQQEEEIEQERQERIFNAKLTLDDFADFNKQINKMGGISKILSSMPGGDKAINSGRVDEHAIDNMVVIINSMTKAERHSPEILNGSRRARIAKGAGVRVQDVNQLIQKFNQMRKMLKKMVPNLENPDLVPSRKNRRKNKKKKTKRRAGIMNLPGMQGLSFSDLRNLQSQFKDLNNK